MATTLPSPPLPTFPLEVKHEILKLCDQSALARTSQVSLAFLQLSSPLLYRDINVDSDQLKMLLSLTVEIQDVQPHLRPYLILSLIKSITFTPSSDSLFASLSLQQEFVPTRLLRESLWNDQLPLQTLEISLSEANHSYDLPISHYFSPVCFRLHAPPGSREKNATVVDVLGDFRHGWFCLEETFYENAFTVQSFHNLEARPKRMVFDVAAEGTFDDAVMNQLWEELVYRRSGPIEPLSLKVVLIVSDRYQKEWIEADLEGYDISERLAFEVRNGSGSPSSAGSSASSSP